MKSCRACGRELHDGELAWADDWKVLDTGGNSAVWRTEVRLTCDTCASKESAK